MNSPPSLIGAKEVLEPGRFYGEILKAESCRGVLLSDTKYEGGASLPQHEHELAFVCLLLDGAYSESYGTKTISYKPFTAVFHPPGETHSTQMSQAGGRVFNIEITSAWLERLSECAPLPGTSFDLFGGELSWLALRLYREQQTSGLYSELVIEGLALEMLAAIARLRVEEKRAPAWLQRATDLLQAKFQENMSVSRVAAEAGVHPIHLARVFRRFYGQSVSDYTQRLRIQFACEQLAAPEANLSEVALAAGFADQSHFTRVFKQLTGVTPGAFRNGVRKGVRQYSLDRADNYGL